MSDKHSAIFGKAKDEYEAGRSGPAAARDIPGAFGKKWRRL